MQFGLLISIVLAGTLPAGGTDGDGDGVPSFKERAHSLAAGAALWNLEFGCVPGMAAWAKLPGAEAVSLKEFPGELLKALASRNAEEQDAALRFVQHYAAFARKCAHTRKQQRLEEAVRRVFGPHAKPVVAELAKLLDAENPETRWHAASALLAFLPNQARANSILAERATAKESESRRECCRMVGLLHLNHRAALDTLARGLRDEAPEVRRAAATAVLELGMDAEETIPGLVALLEAGAAAHENVGIRLDTREFYELMENRALAALTCLGSAARGAVPTIVRMFATATADEQRDLLLCLAAIGPPARLAKATMEMAMQDDHNVALRNRTQLQWGNATRLHLVAACALLGVDSNHAAAAKLMNDALRSRDKKTRAHALYACVEVGPKATTLVAPLTDLLADEHEESRIQASNALGRIGPGATTAIPLLERLLAREQDGRNHTFRSHVAAAYALERIGKAGVPALIRATAASSGGRVYAICALGTLRHDTGPAVARLIEILPTVDKETNGRFYAAIALGTLGEDARPARRVLQRLQADPEETWLEIAVDWALMEIPQ